MKQTRPLFNEAGAGALDRVPDCVLRFEAVSKGFGQIQALRDINLNVSRGERLCVLGLNGAGKTTLLNLASGLYRPDKGVVAIDIHKPGSARAVEMTARTFESPHSAGDLRGRVVPYLFRMTDDQEARFHELAADFAVDLGTRASKHSRGRVAKIALVGALAREPHLLLLDEPTTSLDAFAVDKLQSELSGLANTAVVVASHQVGFARHVTSRVVVLSDGYLVFDGRWVDLGNDVAAVAKNLRQWYLQAAGRRSNGSG